MLTKEECIQKILTEKNILFYKPGCPYCEASQRLMEALIESEIIQEYSVYYVHPSGDLTNDVLKETVSELGWSGSQRNYPTKPQVFVHGEYVGGNDDFYNSKWNIGFQGMIQVEGEKRETPELNNPL